MPSKCLTIFLCETDELSCFFNLLDTYFGRGTVDNIQCHLNAEDSKASSYVSHCYQSLFFS